MGKGDAEEGGWKEEGRKAKTDRPRMTSDSSGAALPETSKSPMVLGSRARLTEGGLQCERDDLSP